MKKIKIFYTIILFLIILTSFFTISKASTDQVKHFFNV